MNAPVTTYDLIVIGAGLAGMSTAMLAARDGREVLVIERSAFPQHKVCGEYISNESRPFLERLGLPIESMQLPEINRFRVSSMRGTQGECGLDPGGFGISRYALDEHLRQLAMADGVSFLMESTAEKVELVGDRYEVSAGGMKYHAKLVVGAWGRNGGRIDNRPLRKGRAWIGVKYHVADGPPSNVIEIHAFKGGYAGISQVEDGRYCLCYLCDAEGIKAYKGNIRAYEAEVLGANPKLANRLLADRTMGPVTTSQFYFGVRKSSDLLLGDALGFIPPLTGNGMSLALRSSHALYPAIRRAMDAGINDAFVQAQFDQYRSYVGTRIRKGVMLQQTLLSRPVWLHETLMTALTNSPKLLQRMTSFAVGKTFG